MSEAQSQQVRQQVEKIYETESRRVFASLVRLLGDFDLAEEAMHDAFAAAVEKWEQEGIPKNPRAWLVSTGRFKGIDTIRRRVRFDASVAELARSLDDGKSAADELTDSQIRDDQLRLIFTCCHPALPSQTQVALTLREVCGLTTEEVASAFLASSATIAQRIVRGKSKIRDAGIPYEIPSVEELPARLESVLSVIYLVFNEGYSASSGDQALRTDLSSEAIRLGRVLFDLLPDPEVAGLLALMLLHESRREARTSPDGNLILLEDQDRTRWDRELIAEGKRFVEQAFEAQEVGAYAIQAAISATHAEASVPEETDWNRIVSLYDLLLQAGSSPVVELNRAVAVAMRDGPDAGLELLDELLTRGELESYHLAHAARADFCRRLNRNDEARHSYEQALTLAKQEPERRFLEKRLQELGYPPTP